jgi:hypothetical protein
MADSSSHTRSSRQVTLVRLKVLTFR